MPKPKTETMRKSVRWAPIGRVSPVKSKILSAVKSKNTKPELELQSLLRGAGLKFAAHPKSLIGRPDIAFKAQRVLIFCDGDFWHGRRWKKRLARNEFQVRRSYWIAKIESNIKRDRSTNRTLRKLGWRVLRVWESDIKKNPDKVLERILSELKKPTSNARRN